MSTDGQDSLPCDQLKAFLHVGFHGSDPEMRDSGDLMIIDDLSVGQFDLQWCSIRCMRKWLTQLLDKLEANIGRADEGRDKGLDASTP